MATISLCPPSSSRLVPTIAAAAAALPSLGGWSRAARTSARTFLSTDPATESSAPAPSPALGLWTRASSALAELFPAILLAVPKSKISHSRKSMRSANKGLRNKSNFSNCPACGTPKLAHHTCPVCYSQINRRWKSEAREAVGAGAQSEHEVVIRHET